MAETLTMEARLQDRASPVVKKLGATLEILRPPKGLDQLASKLQNIENRAHAVGTSVRRMGDGMAFMGGKALGAVRGLVNTVHDREPPAGTILVVQNLTLGIHLQGPLATSLGQWVGSVTTSGVGRKLPVRFGASGAGQQTLPSGRCPPAAELTSALPDRRS